MIFLPFGKEIMSSRVIARVINSIIKTEGIEQDLDQIVDVVRAYSAEVEYSQKNLDKLFNFTFKFIEL